MRTSLVLSVSAARQLTNSRADGDGHHEVLAVLDAPEPPGPEQPGRARHRELAQPNADHGIAPQAGA